MQGKRIHPKQHSAINFCLVNTFCERRPVYPFIHASPKSLALLLLIIIYTILLTLEVVKRC